MSTRLSFAEGNAGMWRLVQSQAIAGEPLFDVERMSVARSRLLKMTR